MRRGELLRALGVEHPVVQAPMAGGTTTPELVAAVSSAGGLGSLGAAYLAPEQILEAAARIRALTDRPFAVNLFAGGYDAGAAGEAGPMLALLAEVHAELGLPAPTLPALPPDPFEDQLAAVLEARPAVFSFTFGIPPAARLAEVRAAGMLAVGTATTVDEGRLLANAGVDAVVAQGAEAGAHRGTFAAPFEDALVPTRRLVSQLVAATSLPVLASGGLMEGGDVAAVLALGAEAAQLGTAFLPCPESGAPPAHKQAVLEARTDGTVITRAFSGRPARGLANAFVARVAERGAEVLPYPLQNALTRAMRTAAARRGAAGYLSLWAGQGVARARARPAATLVRELCEEAAKAR